MSFLCQGLDIVYTYSYIRASTKTTLGAETTKKTENV